jgi:hypothetical protein
MAPLVLVRALREHAKRFYERYGFPSSPTNY